MTEPPKYPDFEPRTTVVRDRTFYWTGRKWKEIGKKHNTLLWNWIGRMIIVFFLYWIFIQGYDLNFNLVDGITLFLFGFVSLAFVFKYRHVARVAERVFVPLFQWISRRRIS